MLLWSWCFCWLGQSKASHSWWTHHIIFPCLSMHHRRSLCLSFSFFLCWLLLPHRACVSDSTARGKCGRKKTQIFPYRVNLSGIPCKKDICSMQYDMVLLRVLKNTTKHEVSQYVCRSRNAFNGVSVVTVDSATWTDILSSSLFCGIGITFFPLSHFVYVELRTTCTIVVIRN